MVGKTAVKPFRALAGAVFSTLTAAATPPSVTISCCPWFDAVCAFVQGYEVRNAWKKELAGDTGSYRRLWKKIGPKLLVTTEQVTGKPFGRGHVSAYLTLCDLPSQATLFGIFVNMRYALSSFTDDPVPIRYKVGVLYHEILHDYVERCLPKDSALLKRHRDESPRIREHLHLLALQKAVYLKLGMAEALEEVVAIDSRLPGGDYVGELRQAAP
jgi:hypothetical protein